MPRPIAGAGGPLEPEQLPDWLFLIGRRPPGERRSVAAWLAAECPHLLQPNGRPVPAFDAERRRRRWQELNGEGRGYFTRLYRAGDSARPGDDDIDAAMAETDPRRLMAETGSGVTSLDVAIADDLAFRRGWVQHHHDKPGQPIRTSRRTEP